MHLRRLIALDELRCVPVALKQTFQLSPLHAGEKGGIGNLVTIQMENRNHRAVPAGMNELVREPACGEGPGLSFTVPDDAKDDAVV